MTESFRYKCPYCGGEFTYTSRKAQAPKYCKTNCKKCKKQLEVRQHLLPLQKCSLEERSDEIDNFLKTIKSDDPQVADPLRNLSQMIQSQIISNEVKENGDFPESDLPGGSTPQITLPKINDMFSCHCLRYKIPLEKAQPYFKWDKSVKMNGWIKKIYVQSEFKVEMTTKHLIINISKKIYGHDYNEIFGIAEKFTWAVIGYFEKNGFKCGKSLELSQKPHIVLPHNFMPKIRQMGASYLLSSENGLVIDDSPQHGEGEIELITGKEKLDRALEAPQQMKDLINIIYNQQQQIQQLIGIKEKEQTPKTKEVDIYS